MHSVNHFDLVQSFIEHCERGVPVEALTRAFHDTVERLGIRYFACYTHSADPLDPPRDAILVHNYPAAWVRVYSEARLHEIDPVLRHAECSPLPFFWDAPAFRARLTAPQNKLLAAADTFGLAHGYTIPIHLSWTPGSLCASCSVVPSDEAVDARTYLGLQLMASYLYVAVSRARAPWTATTPVELTHRERQCLTLVAQGKDDWTVGRLLRLSPVTVHTYVERAKERLQVATRVQAVVQAFLGRQISCGDVVRARETESEGPKELECGRTVAGNRLKRLEYLARSRL